MSGEQTLEGSGHALPSGLVADLPLTDLPLADLLDTAQGLAAELARRMTRSDFVDVLASVSDVVPSGGSMADGSPAPSGPTLTAVQSGLERLARTVDAARTAVAGHTDRVFESPRERSRLLGLPPGKTGFRSSADFMEQTLHIPRRDARNRVARAQHHLGAAGIGGVPDPSGDRARGVEATPRVSGALWDGTIDPAAVDLVTRTLNDARAAGRRVGAPSAVVDELVSAGEERLMAQAVQVSPTTLAAICRRWRQRFDVALRAHGPDPDDQSAAEARALIYRGRERGLHQWLLNLTDDQHEILKTVASAGSNPRAGTPEADGGDASGGGVRTGGVRAGSVHAGRVTTEDCHDSFAPVDASTARGAGTGAAPASAGRSAGTGAAVGVMVGTGGSADGELALWPEGADVAGPATRRDESVLRDETAPLRDPRRRAQRELDAVMSALQAALEVASTGDLSATGGSRPQVLVTIDVETLTDALLHHPDPPGSPGAPNAAGPPNAFEYLGVLDAAGSRGSTEPLGVPNAAGPPAPGRLHESQTVRHGAGADREMTPDTDLIVTDRAITSSAAFSGPIDPRIIRAWACDADLIPVVLGGAGQVLDVGRTQRLFPLRLRRAIIARDQGCAAPGCSIPAPWCDVHHVEYWENGGPTSVDNGVLLCQHHHQTVHHGQWRIEVRNGVPWFQNTGPRFAVSDQAQPKFERNAHWHDAA